MANKILIADDSAMQRDMQRSILADQGIDNANILEAQNGAEALKLATTAQGLRLIISDWNMPGMNGIDFITEFRKVNQEIPILMITSESDESKLIAAYEAGANGFLNKPVEPDALREAIAAFAI